MSGEVKVALVTTVCFAGGVLIGGAALRILHKNGVGSKISHRLLKWSNEERNGIIHKAIMVGGFTALGAFITRKAAGQTLLSASDTFLRLG